MIKKRKILSVFLEASMLLGMTGCNKIWELKGCYDPARTLTFSADSALVPVHASGYTKSIGVSLSSIICS